MTTETQDAGQPLSVTGRLFRVARLRDEWYADPADPVQIINTLKASAKPPDLFSFIQRPPDVELSHSWPVVPDHVAAVPLTSFDNWWNQQVSKKVRKNVRRSEKRGIEIRTVPFDDALLHGIQRIYRETPLRSGRPFRHFHDDLATCRRKHETFAERSTFIGAFFKGELIGFIKLVEAGQTARTMQNISMDAFRELSPANAMLAHAVRHCVDRQLKHLVYGKLEYGKKGNPGLEEFKKANGFIRLEFPRYYVPLTTAGSLALKLGLHRDYTELLPRFLILMARNLRTRWYKRRFRMAE